MIGSSENISVTRKVKLFKDKAARKKLTLSWKTVKNVSGYEVQYGLKKNFKAAKKVKVKANKNLIQFKYRTAGVREYWIVNPLTNTVNVYDLENF